MKHLWAPWRMEYIEKEIKGEGCIFCSRLREDDGPHNLILYRSSHAFVIMNKFPYNPGHLMICPFRHERDIENLSVDEARDLFECLKLSVKVLKKVMEPHGYNIGLNSGRVAGAGVEDHLHFHIVPRWNGDTNFMPVLAEVKVVPEHLERTYRKLKTAFEEKVEAD